MTRHPSSPKQVLSQARRRFLAQAGSVALAGTVPAATLAEDAAEQEVLLPLHGLDQRSQWRIAFGSCARQNKPQPIWQAISQAQPDLFAFIGDNLYADAKSAQELATRYAEFHALEVVQKFRRQVPHIAIYDDHDYGDDDVGAEYPYKRESQRLFCDEWNEPANSPRRMRPGVYQSYRIDAQGRSVQIILMDLRFNRTPLKSDPARKSGYADLMRQAAAGSTQPIPGWYVPNPDPQATILGDQQWQWLEQQLRRPADLRLVVSTIQFAAEGTGWESWSNFPRDRQRLIDQIRTLRADNVVFLSGDMHYGEVSRLDIPGQYPLWDITSSGLTEVWSVPTPNLRRASPVIAEPNFGVIDIDWHTRRLVASVRGVDGGIRLKQDISLDSLRMV